MLVYEFSTMSLSTTIGVQLRATMKRNKWTQMHLAERFKVDQSRISRICAGRFKRVTPLVEKLCEYAHIETKALGQESALPKDVETAVRRLLDGSADSKRAVIRLLNAGLQLQIRRVSKRI
jgi:transcriptional regulator with XRE-family HTH domain